jgi:hypothetical protein
MLSINKKASPRLKASQSSGTQKPEAYGQLRGRNRFIQSKLMAALAFGLPCPGCLAGWTWFNV